MTGRVIFVGAVHEAVPALGVLLDGDAEVAEVVTLPAERGRSAPPASSDLEPLARAHGIPVRRCADINSPQSVQHTRDLRPDLMVVTGWSRLLSAELLSVPPRGVIGFHASLLPRCRGRAPVNWAILRGETVTGNTMMMLNAGTDTGDIVDQLTVTITLDDTCATVYAKIGEAGADMLRRHLPALLDGTAPRRPQGEGGGPPLPKRTPGMGVTLTAARRPGSRLDPRSHLALPGCLHLRRGAEGDVVGLGGRRRLRRAGSRGSARLRRGWRARRDRRRRHRADQRVGPRRPARTGLRSGRAGTACGRVTGSTRFRRTSPRGHSACAGRGPGEVAHGADAGRGHRRTPR